MNWSVDMKKSVWKIHGHMVSEAQQHKRTSRSLKWSQTHKAEQTPGRESLSAAETGISIFASRAARAKACRSMLKSQEMYVKRPLTVIFPSWQRLKDTTESETGALDTHPHTQTHTGTLPLLPPNRYRPHYWKLTDRALHNLLTNDTTGRN